MSGTPSRRQFFDRILRVAGLAGLGGAGVILARRAPGTVFQIDPNRCSNAFGGSQNPQVCDLCRVSCVLSHSAVKAVNDFSKCGYCMLCPAYFDVSSDPDNRGIPTGKVCPRDAIVRKVVGKVDADDPNNNFYEYTIDESKCDGCGRCVKACQPPFGNGALRLEIRYDRCVECNTCSIQVACTRSRAVQRVPAPGISPEVKAG